MPRATKKISDTCERGKDFKREKKVSRYYTRSSDGKYYGIHCYFQTCNKFFPWELQIWDEEDRMINYREHKRHELERKDRLV